MRDCYPLNWKKFHRLVECQTNSRTGQGWIIVWYISYNALVAFLLTRHVNGVYHVKVAERKQEEWNDVFVMISCYDLTIVNIIGWWRISRWKKRKMVLGTNNDNYERLFVSKSKIEMMVGFCFYLRTIPAKNAYNLQQLIVWNLYTT